MKEGARLRAPMTGHEEGVELEGLNLRFGDELVVRATGERVFLLSVLDMSGSLLVGKPEAEPFQVHADEVLTLRARHGCGCC